MAIVPINPTDGGLLRDPFAPDIKDGAWSDGMNVSFNEGYVSRTAGHVAPYGAAPIRALNAFPLSAGSERLWIIAGQHKLYAVKGDGTYENITRRQPGPQEWTFDADVESWTAQNGTATWADGELVLTKTGGTGNLHAPSPGSLTIDGSKFTRIRLRARADAGAAYATFTVFYSTSGHSFDNGYRKVVTALITEEPQTIVIDMAALTAGADDWVTNTITQIRLTFGTAVDASVFRFDEIALEGDVDYATDPEIGWTGTVLGGILVLNNGIDVPQAYAGNGQAIDMPDWPSTWRARSIRAYRNFLVAINVTKGSDRYPHLICWSTQADPGTLPATWITGADNDAGELPVAEDPTELVDACELGGSLIVYKEGSYRALTFTGGTFVMDMQRISGDGGLIGPNCVCAFPGGHFVLGQGDVFVHEGGPPRSVIDIRMRHWLFNTIDAGQLSRLWVAANPVADELWIGVPTGADHGCTLAAIWNWKADAWTIRELPGVSGAGTGVVDAMAMNTWDQQTITWEEATATWGQLGIPPSAQRLMLASSQDSRLYLTQQGDSFADAPIAARLVREGITLGDADAVKILRRFRPMIDAAPGTTLQMRMGGAMDQVNGTQWNDWRDYVVGDDEWFDDFVSGKYLALEIRSTGVDGWRMRSLLLDVVGAGRR